LDVLLEENETRDQFLLSDELKKKNQLAFMKAIRVYLSNQSVHKAKNAFEVLKRIENMQSGIFQFPTEEDFLITKERQLIEEKMKNI
jgi:hypothetical protein